MAITQLTQVRISIPALPGLVPVDCYPGGVPSQDLPSSRRVSFAKDVTVLGDAPPPARSPECGTQALFGSVVAEDDVIETMGVTIDCTDTPPTIFPPPPGFSQFSWPYADWSVNNGQSLFPFTKDPPRAASQIFLGDGRLLCLHCRCRRLLRIVLMIRWLRLWARPETSRSFRLRLGWWCHLWEIVALRDLQTRFLGGGWLGKARFWPSGRQILFFHSVPDVRFGIPPIGHRTTLRRQGSSVFPCIIRSSSSGLLSHSRLAF